MSEKFPTNKSKSEQQTPMKNAESLKADSVIPAEYNSFDNKTTDTKEQGHGESGGAKPSTTKPNNDANNNSDNRFIDDASSRDRIQQSPSAMKALNDKKALNDAKNASKDNSGQNQEPIKPSNNNYNRERLSNLKNQSPTNDDSNKSSNNDYNRERLNNLKNQSPTNDSNKSQDLPYGEAKNGLPGRAIPKEEYNNRQELTDRHCVPKPTEVNPKNASGEVSSGKY